MVFQVHKIRSNQFKKSNFINVNTWLGIWFFHPKYFCFTDHLGLKKKSSVKMTIKTHVERLC